MNVSITLQPLLPMPLVVVLATLALVLLGLGFARGGRGLKQALVWRLLAITALVLALLNPHVVSEKTQALDDVVVVIVDRSESQSLGDRRASTDAALSSLQDNLSRYSNVDILLSETQGTSKDKEGTHLISALEQGMAGVSPDRLAAAVLITDGQVHDAEQGDLSDLRSPVHVLLTGKREEKDRRVFVEKTPGYGIVGKEVVIRYRIEDNAPTEAGTALVHFRVNGEKVDSGEVPVGRSDTFKFELEHGGAHFFEIQVDALPDESSVMNNRAVGVVNGIRERLKVLLVSGQPHSGERTWRNFLKSDPSVDLVHFTVLKLPGQDVSTPVNELSLIPFPTHELFEEKLNEFDLIVFDRYTVRGFLSPSNQQRIETYLLQGGALLFADGPELTGHFSLAKTMIGALMPSIPTGKVFEQPFVPEITEVGRRHPVLAGLQKGEGRQGWSPWFRQLELELVAGSVVMAGVDDSPLLILDRTGMGRVAQFASDQIWLWARGYKTGGPHGELMRRVAHWLMKEPELEEYSLQASVKDGMLHIMRRDLKAEHSDVTVTSPSGDVWEIPLEPDPDSAGGLAVASIKAVETGLYSIADDERTVLAAAGSLNPPELMDLRATDEILSPIVKATGGGVFWLADGMPDVRRVGKGRDGSGRNWLGLVENQAVSVTGVTDKSLMPAILVLILTLLGLMAGWWREGR